jgi:Undecaprenyl-phosphate glucose phosphotransferase
MLKEKSQLFQLLFAVSDIVVVSVAWLLAYWLRFQTDLIPVEKGIPPFSTYFSALILISIIWASVFKRFGLYQPMRGVRRSHELWLLLNANTIAMLIFIASIYIFKEKNEPFSRLVFAYFGFFAIFFTVIERSFLRFILREIRRKGYNLRYMLIVGAGKVAEDLVKRVRKHSELGMQLIGCLSKDGKEVLGPCGVPILGNYYDIKKCLATINVDQLIVALPLEDNHLLHDVMSQVQDTLVDVKIVPDIYQFISLGGSIEEFEGLPLVSIQSTPLEGIGRIMKRLLDVILSIGAFMLFLPLFLLICILVKCTSKGPVFYKQIRVSFDGSKFNIYKFRTMYMYAEEKGPGWTVEGDSRVTPLGKFLRKTSFDELPQILNVLRGDMSFVGPRPERPVYIEEFKRRVPRYMLRHKVPAGMTGWAQVHGWRGDTSIDKRIEFDLYYIENWSLLLDLKILFLTVFKGFRNTNAY